jgi:hypothetical protein
MEQKSMQSCANNTSTKTLKLLWKTTLLNI